MAELPEDTPQYCCPDCGGGDFKKYTWKSPMLLNWILNPGAGIVEFPFGVRIPKTYLECKTCPKAWLYRLYIRCPHCGAMHKSGIWSARNSFAHWLGYVCPDCAGVIPCYWNVLSLLLLVITFPLWILPVKLYRKRWLEMEYHRSVKGRERYETVQQKSLREFRIFRDGICIFGGLFFVVMSLLQVIDKSLSDIPLWDDLWVTIPGWLLISIGVGAVSGFLMKRVLFRTVQNNKSTPIAEQQESDQKEL